MHRALLIGDQGYHFLISLEMVSLLSRSGFEVDIVSNNPISKHLKSVSESSYVQRADDLPHVALSKLRGGRYDLVVVLEDFTLKVILDSGLTDDDKLDLLPVVGKEHFRHLCSKSEISELFRREGILTPDFAVAHSRAELAPCAEKVGYPVLVKIDFSGAGDGIFECTGPGELEAASNQIDRWPVLVQEFIEGTELDLSAFYKNSKLVFCSYSRFERTMAKFSPSSLRTYSQLGRVEQDVFEEMHALGRATGADGFVNIVCMLSNADHRRYFIEADMRPNAWVNAPRHLGDDPAFRIASYFVNGEVFTERPPVNPGFPDELVVPSSTRLPLWELVINRYGSWACLPQESAFAVFLVLAEPKMKEVARAFIKPLVSAGLWSRFKKTYDTAFRKLTTWRL